MSDSEAQSVGEDDGIDGYGPAARSRVVTRPEVGESPRIVG